MYSATRIVKTLALTLCLGLLAAAAVAGEDASAPQPHMIYFYNPSCRLCTSTNETVAAAEEKYKDVMSSQRFDTADTKMGLANMELMFGFMDDLELPPEDSVTLIVFLGLLEKDEDGDFIFTPERALVEGDEIIEKLDKEAADFLSKQGKGEKLGLVRPAPFFRLPHGSGLGAGA